LDVLFSFFTISASSIEYWPLFIIGYRLPPSSLAYANPLFIPYTTQLTASVAIMVIRAVQRELKRMHTHKHISIGSHHQQLR
jgi:hypothetical protein